MGLLAAYQLRGRGLDVALLERDQPGRQASWASAGILSKTVSSDRDPYQGLRGASAPLFPQLVAQLEDESGVDTQYTMDGVLVPALTDEDARLLKRDTDLLRRLGQEVEFVEGTALREAEPAVSPKLPGGRLEVGGQIDPRRLCQALELACRRRGVAIETGAVVLGIRSAAGKVQGVDTLAGPRDAEMVVVAAGSWSGQLPGCEPRQPVVPQRGQILALSRRDVPVRRVITVPNDPYLVPRPDGRVIVGATREFAGYEAALTARGVAWLLQSAIDLVPGLADSPVHEMWTGFRPLSADGLPSIGPGNLAGLYFATGHGPSGIAPAPASIALLVALMLGDDPPIPPEPYDPRRFA
jgi:glycine oxidase